MPVFFLLSGMWYFSTTIDETCCDKRKNWIWCKCNVMNSDCFVSFVVALVLYAFKVNCGPAVRANKEIPVPQGKKIIRHQCFTVCLSTELNLL